MWHDWKLFDDIIILGLFSVPGFITGLLVGWWLL